jgi:Zn-dependent M28 family amino/carboxypeptidase
MISMPGKSWSGPLPPLDAREAEFRAQLERDVVKLAGEIGERNVERPAALAAALEHISAELSAAGYSPRRLDYEVQGLTVSNVDAEVAGSSLPEEIVIVGGHYDSVWNCPGANDNGTGVASMLALARAFRSRTPARTVRFAAFVNEEPPFFQTGDMGSRVYARRCREMSENVVAMLSLETMGCFSDAEGSQSYPFPFSAFYPSKANFIAFVGNVRSRGLVRRAIGCFREHARFPSEGGAVPGMVPGVGWSDHWSFWEEGYPAIMVTDTAPFRYAHYHLASDTPDKVDFDSLARIVAGLEKVVENLASGD